MLASLVRPAPSLERKGLLPMHILIVLLECIYTYIFLSVKYCDILTSRVCKYVTQLCTVFQVCT